MPLKIILVVEIFDIGALTSWARFPHPWVIYIISLPLIMY